MASIVGESAWVAAIEEKSRSARGLESRIDVVELYKQATTEERGSLRLWLGYCQWIQSIYTESLNEDASWDEEEKLLAQELFAQETIRDIWQQGAQATKFRLNDSHELWNLWIAYELEELENNVNEESIAYVRGLFQGRLQVPHSTWDDTFQKFSSFVTKYDETSYEQTMVQTIQQAKSAKEQYALRDEYESNIRQAVRTRDDTAEGLAWKIYLDWELEQSRKKGASLDLCVALHERALLRYGTVSAELWEDCADLVRKSAQANSQVMPDDPEDREGSRLMVVLKSATNHCPWSGQLWVRLLLAAESEGLEFSSLEGIKEAAITLDANTGLTGLELVYQVCSAWCGVLRRQSDKLKLLAEGEDMALNGTRSTSAEVEKMGAQLYGAKKFKGDPKYRLELALIQCLTERRLLKDARKEWKNLTARHGASYEFWQRYYNWEMNIWASSSNASDEAPSLATSVLAQAIQKNNLDWPERLVEMLTEHCERYEDAATIQDKAILARGVMKKVARRREREAAAYGSEQPAFAVAVETPEEPTSQTSKRKRDSESEGVDTNAKKVKSAAKTENTAAQNSSQTEEHLKRDRENTSVVVTNLPAEVAQTKVRQYFKEYGHINNLKVKLDDEGVASTALIEFRSTEDVQSALLRDGKFFNENQIHVKAATGLTLYVTNYPPTADDKYMHDLFKDCGDIFSIRWPSLKYNTHRRFCYISFRTAEAAAAATQLDGKMLEGVYKLDAKYSDPSAKKSREGAMNEGRELHISNLDFNATEDEVKEIFSKHGSVESVRILRNMAGRSKGSGFVVFEKKDSAEAALALDKTKFKRNILTVELSAPRTFKPTATSGTVGKASSASPAPDGDGDVSMSPAPPHEHASKNPHVLQGPAKDEIARRTIALMNIPDTVNDARVRALVSPHGTIIKLVLRPDHQGAIIEFEDVSSAGKASLALEGHEIAPGRKLRTGGLKDLFKEKDEYRTDKIQIGTGAKQKQPAVTVAAPAAAAGLMMQQNAPIRRPGQAKRGGLGSSSRKGLGFVGAGSKAEVSVRGGGAEQDEDRAAPAPAPQKKSNADFAALYKKEDGNGASL